jgi:hypothetical protein
VFRNENSDAGESPRRKHTTYRTWQKFEIKKTLFYSTIAVYVSGIIITHPQEHKTTVTTASGNRYTVMDRVKFTDK